MQKKIVIAVDGYSSCGKSTLAKDVASQLHIKYIDTGAMYRAVTLFALNNQLSDDALKTQLKAIKIDFRTQEEGQVTCLNGKIVEEQIRGLEVANKVSYIAQIKEVRDYLVKMQRELAENDSVILDGRDIGTVVFPNADLKIFMTASTEVRAERRYIEMVEKHPDITIEQVAENITQRDFIDENREESPLRKADDAFVLDNSNISRKEQLDLVLERLKEKKILE